MIEIDGAQGEGGGQVLRTSLALSILTGQDLRIRNIRRGRSKPGLAAQHLAAVRAAEKVSSGRAEGAMLGSTELVFIPGEIREGRYRFDIPTAGATTLVLQTIFLPLLRAGGPSNVTISGGTHVPWSPCYHYLEMQWLPALRKMGVQADMALELAGFYPRGGGRITARIHPAGSLSPLDLTQRGALLKIRGLSAVAGLDREIASRQRRRARERLEGLSPPDIRLIDMPSRSKGTMLLLLAEFERSSACYFSLGARGKRAEHVADESVEGIEHLLSTEAAVDPYLADQLLLPLALADGPSALRTARVSGHLLTNAAVIQSFLPASIEIHGQIGEPGSVEIRPV